MRGVWGLVPSEDIDEYFTGEVGELIGEFGRDDVDADEMDE